MCGIAGIIKPNGIVDPSTVDDMCTLFAYRGPDDKGLWQNAEKSVCLGHRRLSIIDTSHSGHQPMIDPESQCVLIFNGEVYNYLEIRKQLEAEGYTFSTKTDSEVILKSYLAYGKDCVHRFNGMFAIAIWDPRQQHLFMLRDRLGIKPFYYYLDDETLIFASETKAINQALGRKASVDNGLIDSYMSFGYIPGENTLQTGVKRLMPGHMAVYKPGTRNFQVEQYWDIPFGTEEDLGEEYYLEKTGNLINSAIDLRLRSDVPLGIFLSGGIDSSAVVALLAQRSTEQLKTYSVAFDFGKNFNETPYARMVAEKYNTDHHELFVKPESFRDFIPDYIHLMDEPVTESAAISLCFLSKMTTKDVTVVLSGEGSDEVFGGYSLYNYMSTIDKYRAFIGDKLARHIAKLAKLPMISTHKLGKYLEMSAHPLENRYKGISTYDERIKNFLYKPEYRSFVDNSHSCKELQGFLSSLFQRKGADSLSKMLYFDTKTWLVDDLLIKADRMSMAASLELRVPFLDYRLVEFAAKMPSKYKINRGQNKYLLKKLVSGILPDEIVHRKKMGFPTPLKLMFQGAMKDYSHDLLLGNSKISSFFQPSAINELLSSHHKGQADHHRVLWQLVVLEEWLQQNG